MPNVIIHCSDSPNDREVRAAEIHAWHRKRGWDGIGYHYVIGRDGLLEAGRPEYWTGAHCKGHNEDIGICLIGRDRFTGEQADVLTGLLYELKERIGSFEVFGHYELDESKTCPNFDAGAWWRDGLINHNEWRF